jgi:hypothetical protein
MESEGCVYLISFCTEVLDYLYVHYSIRITGLFHPGLSCVHRIERQY